MDLGTAIRWTLVQRTISGVAFLLGVAIVAAGLVVGLGESLAALAANPGQTGEALAAANLPILAVTTVLGVIVWRLGEGLSVFLTVPPAAGADAADQYDTERLKSEVLEVMDQRLAAIEGDIDEIHRRTEETNRAIGELKRQHHAEDVADSPRTEEPPGP